MIRKTLSYRDFNDEPHTEDFYFHLSKPELIDLEVSQAGGLSTFLPKMIAAQDMGVVVDLFKKIVRMSLGIRSEDGKKFDKRSQEARAYVNEFMDSPAYEALFDDLTSNDTAAAEFIVGLVPAGLISAEDVAAGKAAGKQAVLTAPAELPWAHREPTNKELTEMTHAQLLEVYARKHRSPQPSPEE
jgi:hypothetical protein